MLSNEVIFKWHHTFGFFLSFLFSMFEIFRVNKMLQISHMGIEYCTDVEWLFTDISIFRLWWSHPKLHCSITWVKLNSHQKRKPLRWGTSTQSVYIFCSHLFYQRITWDMLVYFIWLSLLNNLWLLCDLFLKKCSDVDTLQRKYLRQVRIESKIAAPRLIKLNKIFASSAVSI